MSNLDVEKKQGATVVGRGNSCGKGQQLWDDQDNHKLRPIIIVVLGFIGKKLIAEEPEEEEKLGISARRLVEAGENSLPETRKGVKYEWHCRRLIDLLFA